MRRKFLWGLLVLCMFCIAADECQGPEGPGGGDEVRIEALPDSIDSIVPCNRLTGMARFTEEAISRCGCPDCERIPAWLGIPRCPCP